MDYFLNEFSLTGQFDDLNQFYSSFRDNLSKVLKKISLDGDSVIYKTEDFWSLHVTKQVTLLDALKYKPGKNNRLASAEQIKVSLQKLICNKPYLQEREIGNDIDILEHKFDQNEIIHKQKPNSIYYVVCNDRCSRLISFKHSSYENWILRLRIKNAEDEEYDVDIKNIYSDTCWFYLEEIKKWPLLDNKYWIEVRAKEIDRHQPHFHVTENRIKDRSMVFSIDNCRVLEPKNRDLYQWEKDMKKTILGWFELHNVELRNAWELLHPSMY